MADPLAVEPPTVTRNRVMPRRSPTPTDVDAEGHEPASDRLVPTRAAFPEFSWLTFHHDYADAATRVHHVQRRACHAVVLHAAARARSIVGSEERGYDLRKGMVGYVPADDREHVVVVTADRSTSAFVLLIPPAVLAEIADAEGIAGDLPESFAFDHPGTDGDLRRLRHLSRLPDAGDPPTRPEAGMAMHDLSRRLVLQVVERLTGRRPEWSADGSPFERRVLTSLIAVIDGDLRIPPRIEDLAMRTGLSPSHCARKFTVSTGMSLARFINVRRVQRAIDHLRQADTCLASLALDLGFSSQSHMTRVFSACTGVSPARYRRAVAPRR